MLQVWQCTELNPRSIGGVQTHIREVSLALQKLGHVVSIGKDLPREEKNATQLILHTHGDLVPTDALLSKVRKNFRNSAWIHVFHGTTPGRMLACREFASLSGYRGAFKEWRLAQGSQAAIAVGENAALEAKRFFFYRKPMQVIANGADLSIFCPLSSIIDKPRAIFLGRGSDHVKNTAMLFRTAQEVKAKHPDFELWMAPGESLAKTVVKNLGSLEGPALFEAMAQCRVLVLCSWYEGDPVVVHEAKAMGLPVIASRIPALEATLQNYENVFWIDPSDSESLGRAFEHVLYEMGPVKPQPEPRGWDAVAKDFQDYYFKLSKNLMQD